MKLSSLTSSDLQKLVKLIAKREGLAAILQEVEAQIDAFSGETPTAPSKPGRSSKWKGLIKSTAPGKPVKGRRGPRKGEKPGKLKATILGALSAAGSRGMSVGELREKLKIKSNNLYSWFYTTGRKVPQLKKNGRKYVYSP